MTRHCNCEFGSAMPEWEFDPEGGDWSTEDHNNFYQYGKLILSLPPDLSTHQMWWLIEKKMESRSFWPNVWWISDHGNAHLMGRPSDWKRYVRNRVRVEAWLAHHFGLDANAAVSIFDLMEQEGISTLYSRLRNKHHLDRIESLVYDK